MNIRIYLYPKYDTIQYDEFAQISPKKVPQSAGLSAGGGGNRYLGNAQIEVTLTSKVLPLQFNIYMCQACVSE